MNTINTAAFPKDSKQLRSFLGTRNLYGRFTKDFLKLAWPLDDYLRKNKETDWSNPTTEALDAFNMYISKFRENFCVGDSAAAQTIYDRQNAFASALEAVLLPGKSNSNLKKWAKIGYRGRTLKHSERNYSGTKCETSSWYELLRPYAHPLKENYLKFEQTTIPSCGRSSATIRMDG